MLAVGRIPARQQFPVVARLMTDTLLWADWNPHWHASSVRTSAVGCMVPWPLPPAGLTPAIRPYIPLALYSIAARCCCCCYCCC